MLAFSAGRGSLRENKNVSGTSIVTPSHALVCCHDLMHNLSRPPPASRRPLRMVTSTPVADSQEHLTLQEAWIHRKTTSFSAIAHN